MLPTEARIKELQQRFGVANGRFFGYQFRFKNLNWYLGRGEINSEKDEWFCFGDIQDEDVPRLQEALEPEEFLILGWKDLGRDMKHDDFFGDGGKVSMVIAKDGVVFDRRRDYPQQFEGL